MIIITINRNNYLKDKNDILFLMLNIKNIKMLLYAIFVLCLVNPAIAGFLLLCCLIYLNPSTSFLLLLALLVMSLLCLADDSDDDDDDD